MEVPAVGHLVRLNLPQLLALCAADPEELPACRVCNSAKGQLRFDEFLASHGAEDAESRRWAIEEHASRHDYAPLTARLRPEQADAVRASLDTLRARVAEAAAAAIEDMDAIVSGRDRADSRGVAKS